MGLKQQQTCWALARSDAGRAAANLWTLKNGGCKMALGMKMAFVSRL
jgi:hypothetical protein